jgi:tetratricopeptide (TPR) repeat protein
MKNAWKPLAAVCVLVIGVYAYMAQPGVWESLSRNAADAYYNLLVQGFRAGQLSLKKDVPPGLAQLADPYDPANGVLYQSPSYRLLDLSYYKGRLFLYFGVTPALILFWPCVVLTGHYVFQSQAVTIFCAIGFLAGVGLLRALWRRYFAEVSAWVVVGCALALGLGTGVPVLLSRSDVNEVAISCGYMLTMLALAAIWCALHEPRRRSGWLAVASVAYGLAVGARPTLLFGAVILLVPVAQSWRERWPESLPRSMWLSGLTAAMGPIVLIGLGLMLYNARRFGSPFEFGVRYQLAPAPAGHTQYFSPRFIWFNLRVYFLEPERWSFRFPFVHEIAVPPAPAGYGAVEGPFGILTNVPLVWLALAAPLAWRRRTGQSASALRWFVMAATLFFGICALTLGFYWWANFRYEVELLPALLLLAAVGILGLEQVLADQPVRRRAARWGWGLLLGFSVAFNLLASVQHYAEAHYALGHTLSQAGRVQEAIEQYALALRIKPDFAEVHYNLAGVFKQQGRLDEAIGQYQQALQIKPDYAEAHNNLGVALGQAGNLQEAIGHLEQAVRIKPDFAEAHNNLGVALELAGRVPEAIGHLEQAVRLKPDFAEAQNRLARLRAVR